MALLCISLNFSKRLPWPKESINLMRMKTNALNGGSAKDTRRRTCAVYVRILLGCSCLLLQRPSILIFFSPLFRFNLFQFTCLPCWPLKFEEKRVASSWNSCCRSHSLIGLSIAPNAVFFKADYCCRQDVHVITQSDVIVYLLYKRRRRSGRRDLGVDYLPTIRIWLRFSLHVCVRVCTCVYTTRAFGEDGARRRVWWWRQSSIRVLLSIMHNKETRDHTELGKGHKGWEVVPRRPCWIIWDLRWC